MTTKIKLIKCAYSYGRISGLTSNPTPEATKLALGRLESLMAEWSELGLCLGYNFEDDPDPNSAHNIKKQYYNAAETNLMLRLCPDFGIEPALQLQRIASTTFSRMSSSLSQPQRVQYPNRQPIGSGNRRWSNWQRYYRSVEKAPTECQTAKMVVGDIDDFYEDFASYLIVSEDIASYTLEAESGLTVTNDAISSPRINYTVEATEAGVFQIKIVATMDSGRVETRIRNFELTTVDSTVTGSGSGSLGGGGADYLNIG